MHNASTLKTPKLVTKLTFENSPFSERYPSASKSRSSGKKNRRFQRRFQEKDANDKVMMDISPPSPAPDVGAKTSGTPFHSTNVMFQRPTQPQPKNTSRGFTFSKPQGKSSLQPPQSSAPFGIPTKIQFEDIPINSSTLPQQTQQPALVQKMTGRRRFNTPHRDVHSKNSTFVFGANTTTTSGPAPFQFTGAFNPQPTNTNPPFAFQATKPFVFGQASNISQQGTEKVPLNESKGSAGFQPNLSSSSTTNKMSINVPDSSTGFSSETSAKPFVFGATASMQSSMGASKLFVPDSSTGVSSKSSAKSFVFGAKASMQTQPSIGKPPAPTTASTSTSKPFVLSSSSAANRMSINVHDSSTDFSSETSAKPFVFGTTASMQSSMGASKPFVSSETSTKPFVFGTTASMHKQSSMGASKPFAFQSTSKVNHPESTVPLAVKQKQPQPQNVFAFQSAQSNENISPASTVEQPNPFVFHQPISTAPVTEQQQQPLKPFVFQSAESNQKIPPISTESLNSAFEDLGVRSKNNAKPRSHPVESQNIPPSAPQNENTPEISTSNWTQPKPFSSPFKAKSSMGTPGKNLLRRSSSKQKSKTSTTQEHHLTNKKFSIHTLCRVHALSTPLSTDKPLQVPCSHCKGLFSTIFCDVLICAKCAHEFKRCPVTNCARQVTVSKSGSTTPKVVLKGRKIYTQVRTKPSAPMWKIQKDFGLAEYSKQRYHEANEAFYKALQCMLDTNTNSREMKKEIAMLYCNLAASLMMIGKIKEAVVQCQLAIDQDPKYIRAYIRAGKGYMQLGKIVDARCKFNEAARQIKALTSSSSSSVSIKPLEKELKKYIFQLDQYATKIRNIEWFIEMKDYESALNSILQREEASVTTPVLQKYQIRCYFVLKRYPDVISICEDIFVSATQIDPRASFISCLGLSGTMDFSQSLQYTDQRQDAEATLVELETLAPTNVDVLSLRRTRTRMTETKSRANLAYRNQEYHLAERLYAQALCLDTQDVAFCATMYCNRAAAKMAQDKFESALRDCDEALVRKPEYARAQVRRARCYLAQRDFDQAIRDFEHVAKNPSHSTLDVTEELERAYAAKREAQVQSQRQRQRQPQDHPTYPHHHPNHHHHRRRPSSNRYAWDDYTTSDHDPRPPHDHTNNRQYCHQKKSPSRPTPSKKGGHRSHYDILGLHRKSSSQEIKKAYRKLALRYHPDKTKDPSCADLFKDMTAAYTVLSDAVTRQEYDRTLNYHGFGVYYES